MTSENSGREQPRLVVALADQKRQLAPLEHSRFIWSYYSKTVKQERATLQHYTTKQLYSNFFLGSWKKSMRTFWILC